jgi:peptide maturation system protein (TIGR04066 family)
MSKEKLLIFPFGKDGIAVIKQIAAEDKYIIEKIIVPRAVLPNGADIGRVKNRNVLGFSVQNSFEDALDSCDTVLVLNHEDSLKEYVHDHLSLAVEKNKKIILMFDPDKDLEELFADNDAEIIDGRKSSKHIEDIEINKLSDIETSVIFVGSIYSVNSVNEIAVDITNIFRKNGHRVTTVSADDNLLLAENYFKLPNFLRDDSLGEVSKIEGFKEWLFKLEKSESPDVIIVAIPDAMMVMDKSIHGGYCIYPFLISSAITPDYFVLDVGCGFNGQFYNTVSTHFAHRYGYHVDYTAVTNLAIDFTSSKEAKKLIYNYRSAKKILSEPDPELVEGVNEVSILRDGYIEKVYEDFVAQMSQ